MTQQEIKRQHPVFKKYTREWLHELTGYSKIYLSRIASGGVPLSRPFIERLCSKLNEPSDELFLPAEPGGCLQPGGCSENGLGQWLEAKCKTGHLSLRQAAARIGISHTTIEGIINGGHTSRETLRKLISTFGGDGPRQRLALEDELLVLAGYRTERPKGEELSEPLAQLIDKASKFSEAQLKMMLHFVEFLTEIGEPELERQQR